METGEFIFTFLFSSFSVRLFNHNLIFDEAEHSVIQELIGF